MLMIKVRFENPDVHTVSTLKLCNSRFHDSFGGVTRFNDIHPVLSV